MSKNVSLTSKNIPGCHNYIIKALHIQSINLEYPIKYEGTVENTVSSFFVYINQQLIVRLRILLTFTFIINYFVSQSQTFFGLICNTIGCGGGDLVWHQTIIRRRHNGGTTYTYYRIPAATYS